LTSTPKIGTNAKKTNEIINRGMISLRSNSVLIAEIKIIIIKAKKVKIRCFVKKKYRSLFILSPAREDVEEKEKNKPKKNKIKKHDKIFLSRLLQ
tara:strand:+ start:57 stop:341 length:285 start_codon:yes stop_codon:yes gene_type:complete